MDNVEILKKILLSNNIKEQEQLIFEIIPELIPEKGFDQKSEWHSYDVWNHTLIAIKACESNFEDKLILLLHDIGKPFSCQEENGVRHFKGHAMKSSEMAIPILRRLGYDEEKVTELSSYIYYHSTKINLDDVNEDNLEFYKRLINIQICDGCAYEPNHAIAIFNELNKTRRELENKKIKSLS